MILSTMATFLRYPLLLAVVLSVLAPSHAAVAGTRPSLQSYSGVDTFWQITDIHWDTRYTTDGDASKMCHSQPGGAAPANGRYGNYLCDAPWPLVQNTLDAMAAIEGDPGFILWTGDMGPHTDDPEPHFDIILETVKNVTIELRSRFPASVAILPVLGNHDSFPKDDFPDCPSAFYRRYLTEGGWDRVLDLSQQESFARGGYYIHSAPSGLRVAVLNTNLYYAFNKLGTGVPDPCGQFAWLEQQLLQASKDCVKVLLSAHSPPGFFERLGVAPFFNVTYNERYLQVVAEHGQQLHSHVYGHLHTDSFRVFDGSHGMSSLSAGFLAPSVTPWQASKKYGGTAVNPSLRLYQYDSASILDYVQYQLNLTLANQPDSSKALVVTSTPHEALVAESVASESSQHSEATEEAVTATTPDSVTDGTTWAASTDFESHGAADGSLPSMCRGYAASRPLKPFPPQSVGAAHWEVYYTAREAYSLERLDGASMLALHGRLTHDQALFDLYYERNSAGVDDGLCRDDCLKTQLCSIRYLTIEGLFTCADYNSTFFRGLIATDFGNLDYGDFALAFSTVKPEIPSALPATVTTSMGSNNTTTTTPPSSSNTTPGRGSSSTINPHKDDAGGSISDHFELPGMPGFLLMVGSVLTLWLLMGLLYGLVRLKRWKCLRNREGGARGSQRTGYTPLNNSED